MTTSKSVLVVNKYILSLQVVQGFRYNDVFIDLADDGRKGDRTVVCWFGTFAFLEDWGD